MIFASAHFVLSQLPNFHSISSISLIAAVMTVRYSFCPYCTVANPANFSDLHLQEYRSKQDH
jgi:uncharacterized membrane protein